MTIDRKNAALLGFHNMCEAIHSRNQWVEVQSALKPDAAPDIRKTVHDAIEAAGLRKCEAMLEIEDALKITK